MGTEPYEPSIKHPVYARVCPVYVCWIVRQSQKRADKMVRKTKMEKKKEANRGMYRPSSVYVSGLSAV